MRPEFFGHERHERVQKRVGLFHDVSHASLGFRLRLLVLAHEDRLQEFDIPVADLIPDETIKTASRFIKAIGLDCRRDFLDRLRQFGEDPAIDRQLCVLRPEVGIAGNAVHLAETRRIP
ncbi:hypothetical protein D3C80_473920 [compost metagenome]